MHLEWNYSENRKQKNEKVAFISRYAYFLCAKRNMHLFLFYSRRYRDGTYNVKLEKEQSRYLYPKKDDS
jgi:hypothetical protein